MIIVLFAFSLMFSIQDVLGVAIYNGGTTTDCTGMLTLFQVSNLTNAFAAVDDMGYGRYVCVNGTGLANATLDHGSLIVSLYQSNDSQVSVTSVSGGHDIFLASSDSSKVVNCKPRGSCQTNETCILGLYSATHSNVTDCTDTSATIKVCCAVEDALNITVIKPIGGYVITTWPVLNVETNKPASCEYSLDSAPYKPFQYTGNTKYHESTIYAANGNHDFIARCTASPGDNSTQFPASFTVDTTCNVNSLVIDSIATDYTPNTLASINISSNCFGIPPARFNVTLNGQKIDAGITENMGYSKYTVSFTTPLQRGTYNLSIGAMGISDEAQINVGQSEDKTVLFMSWSSSGTSDTTEHIISEKNSNYTLGLASDSDKAVTTSSESSISYNPIAGIGYIFMTKSGAKIKDIEQYMKKRTFLLLHSPSFGYPQKTGAYSANMKLDYDNVIVQGDAVLYSGSYSVVIKNKGTDPVTGKTIVEVSALR
jgi:hypothetical protein